MATRLPRTARCRATGGAKGLTLAHDPPRVRLTEHREHRRPGRDAAARAPQRTVARRKGTCTRANRGSWSGPGDGALPCGDVCQLLLLQSRVRQAVWGAVVGVFHGSVRRSRGSPRLDLVLLRRYLESPHLSSPQIQRSRWLSKGTIVSAGRCPQRHCRTRLDQFGGDGS